MMMNLDGKMMINWDRNKMEKGKRGKKGETQGKQRKVFLWLGLCLHFPKGMT